MERNWEEPNPFADIDRSPTDEAGHPRHRGPEDTAEIIRYLNMTPEEREEFKREESEKEYLNATPEEQEELKRQIREHYSEVAEKEAKLRKRAERAEMRNLRAKRARENEEAREGWLRKNRPFERHPRTRGGTAEGSVWSSTLNWEVLAYGHGGYHYNPHVSKPVALEPIGEEGGYHYFGPPPDGGFSYGLYTDGTNTIAAQRAAEVYSPITGAPMKYTGNASYDLIKQALSGSKFPNLLHSCGSCAYAYVTSADYLKSLNCLACGTPSEYGNAMMRGRRAAKK
jgi:hypothetical protein